MTILEQILATLDESGVTYEHVTHPKAITSMDTVAATGFKIENGAKSILFKSRDGYKLVIIRGDNRADFKKLRNYFQTNKLRMATPEEVLDVMGVAVGACYPFGNIAGVEMIVDNMLPQAEYIHFSPGTHYDHIYMKYDDYAHVVNPKLVDVVLN